jgi:hypothetical protein
MRKIENGTRVGCFEWSWTDAADAITDAAAAVAANGAS